MYNWHRHQDTYVQYFYTYRYLGIKVSGLVAKRNLKHAEYTDLQFSGGSTIHLVKSVKSYTCSISDSPLRY